MKIGILYICTGKYTVFWQSFFESCEKFFLPEQKKEYFIFTDGEVFANAKHINIIPQNKLGWPYDTLLRYHMFYGQYEALAQMDYLFFFNANMLFLQEITDEILPTKEKLLGVIHPGFYNNIRSKFTYETNPDSLAYIAATEGRHYFMGGFNGGESEAFLDMCATLAENIENDLEKKIIAIWHDESHLNRYFIDHPPKILSPEYGYPEGWTIPFNKKILIRDKNKFGGHHFLRE